MNYVIMALRFTLEAKKRMVERLSIPIWAESEVIADIVTFWKNAQYSRTYKQFTVHGNRWRYVIDERGNIVTIMKRVKDDDPELVERNKIWQNFVPLDHSSWNYKQLLYNIVYWKDGVQEGEWGDDISA